MLIDEDDNSDGRSPRYSTEPSVSNDDDGDYRSKRLKRNRESSYMVSWGAADFEKQQLEKCRAKWCQVQECCFKVEAALPHLQQLNRHLYLPILEFKSDFYRFWKMAEQDNFVIAAEVSAVLHTWRTLNKEPELEATSVWGKNEPAVFKFEKIMNDFYEEVGVYESVRRYPDSSDSKDEERDYDYRNTQRQQRRH